MRITRYLQINLFIYAVVYICLLLYSIGRSSVGSYLPHNHNSASTQSSFVLRNSSSVKSAVVHEVHKLRLSTSSLFEEMVVIDKENEMEEIEVLKENDGSKTETETSEIQKCPDEIQPGLTKKKKKERRHHEANPPINDGRLEYTEHRSQIITEQNEKSSKTKKHPDYPRTEDNSLPSDSAKEKYSSQLSNEEGQNYSKKIKPRTSKQSSLPETNMLPVDSTEQNENLPVKKKKREKYPQQNNEENETFLGEAAIEEKGDQKRIGKKISNRNDNFEADIEVRPNETREMVNDQEILPDEKKVETSTKRKKKLVEPDINVISGRTSDRVNNPKIPSPDDRQDTNFQKRKSTKSRSLHETGV